MRRRFISVHAAVALVALGFLAACGKRADPLAPYVKTPQPPTAVEVAQIGDEVEIRAIAPRTTTENRPLPVIQLEWYQAPALGDFGKTAQVLLREDVAPGEARTKRFPRPTTDVRYSVRAFQGKARSTFVAPIAYKPMVAPEPPSAITATNTAAGIELRWTNPIGAEPWPTPSLAGSPSPSPSPSLVAGALPGPSPSPGTSPVPSALPSPGPTASPAQEPPPVPERPPAPSAIGTGQAPGMPVGDPLAKTSVGQPPPLASGSPKPSASPTPSPTPPTGIRIFRTDGAPRLAREPLQASSWIDTTTKPGEKPCYALRYATSFKPLVESAPSEPVCVETKDIVPPEPPTRFIGDISATFVELSWLASPSTDVAAYRIYIVDAAGHGTLLLQTEGPILRVRDPNMVSGPRTYAITAIDLGGNESLLSPPLKITVP